ncbi:Stp1/IreP family PP2C-type Ser/Thr phosphatase [Paracidovorax wautersii]|uniref:Protein phosphatase n=1 Tax=Paracidovorax wautersii TaxID=1177982 RepID=A0A1I2FFG0_9BURK|nr:Stp1/IreP family PP2C-type Ser/Thr phosphatase [Paracidovorax wautersii]SFF03211.1 protein phosphatase [Paracidovorax wautersii]
MKPTLAAPLTYEFCALSDCGRVRGNNEDAVLVMENARIAVLADGMGGYNAGEVASGMAVQSIAADMADWLSRAPQPGDSVGRALERSVANANYAILSAALSHPEYSGMGTTLVVGVFLNERLVLGHVGDSRCYRWRNGVLHQLTRDHSWLQEQIDAGLLTPEQAAVSGYRNLVTRALGVDAVVQIEVNEFPVQAGDLFLLCSDGLTDMADDCTLASLMAMPLALPDMATRLVELANLMGGRDNISVVLVAVQGPPATAGGGGGPNGRLRSLMSRLLSPAPPGGAAPA